MDRSKIVAVITGVISLGLAIAYLLLVQFLDSRGPMVPAPVDLSLQSNLNLAIDLSRTLKLLLLS